MDNGVKISKRRMNPDRITITKDSLQRLGDWIDQVASEIKGIKINRNDLVNWLIQKREAKLSVSEVKEIEVLFFDEVKFTEWALKEMKAAKSRGENVSLETLLLVKTQKSKRKRKSKKIEGQHTAAPRSLVTQSDG